MEGRRNIARVASARRRTQLQCKNPDPQLVLARIANVVFYHFEDFRSTERAEDDPGVFAHCRSY